MEENNKKHNITKKIIFIVITIILLIGIIALGTIIIKKDSLETNSSEKNKSTDIKELDLTKSRNTTGYTYSNPTEASSNTNGIAIKTNDKNNTIVTLDWKNGFEKIYSNAVTNQGGTNPGKDDLKVKGLSSNPKKGYLGELGQSPVSYTIFYLLEDGTVQYHPLFKKEKDASGNSYYDMNINYENNYRYFTIQGTVPKAKNIIKLYNVDYHQKNSTGARTTIGATKDGSFYDLGYEINYSITEDIGNTNSEIIKEIDLSKSLNTTNYTYDSLNTNEESGFIVNTNDNKKSITITINEKGSKIISDITHSTWSSDPINRTISGFNKNVKSAFVGMMGHDSTGITFFFIMEDNTLQYAKLFERKSNPDGTMYYASSINDERLNIQEVPNVSDIVKLYTANSHAPQSTGSATTLAAKKDGSFYDLSQIIQ